MGVIVNFAEFVGKQYGDITSPQGKFAKGLSNKLCEVYYDFPGAWTGANNIIAGFQRGFMKSLCADRLPPPPPPLTRCQFPSQHWGTYRASVRRNEGECGEIVYWRQGVIKPVGVKVNHVPVVLSGKWVLNASDGTTVPCAPVNKQIYDSEFFGSAPGEIFYAPVTPNCALGVPEGSGASAFWAKTTYGGILPADCERGGVYPPGNPPPTINKTFNIDYSPDSRESYSFDISTNVDGKFEFPITINVGGVNVTIGFGGIEIGDDGGGVSTPAPDSNGNGTDVPPPNPTEYDVQPPPPETIKEPEEKFESDDSDVVWVLVDIIEEPNSGKTILQRFEADNTYFAGYFAWKVNAGSSYRLEEQPIRKKHSAFLRPSNVDGYSAYTVNNARISLKEYKLKPGA